MYYHTIEYLIAMCPDVEFIAYEIIRSTGMDDRDLRRPYTIKSVVADLRKDNPQASGEQLADMFFDLFPVRQA